MYDLKSAWGLADMTEVEKAWANQRVSELSVKERCQFYAAMQSIRPQTGEEAVNLLLNLSDYEVCYPAGSYEQLGRFALEGKSYPPTILPYIDVDVLGRKYEDEHPGLFVGSCYVQYPAQHTHPAYERKNPQTLKDDGWSVKLKLASPAKPEGVWIRLPDYALPNDGKPDEIAIALNELGVQQIDECTLLDAKCILPEVGELMEQYDTLADLVYDGNDLGFVLDEQGQGMPNFMDRFNAALKYEDCHTLAFALDISQNLECYTYIPQKELRDFAVRRLWDLGMPNDLLSSGAIDFDQFAADMLEQEGYQSAGGGRGFIARNCREFVWERSEPESQGMEPMQ